MGEMSVIKVNWISHLSVIIQEVKWKREKLNKNCTALVGLQLLHTVGR